MTSKKTEGNTGIQKMTSKKTEGNTGIQKMTSKKTEGNTGIQKLWPMGTKSHKKIDIGNLTHNLGLFFSQKFGQYLT